MMASNRGVACSFSDAIGAPETIMFSAASTPIARGSRCVPPAPGRMPSLTSGNAICAQELAVLSRTPEPTSPQQAIGYLPKAIAIIQRQSARLEALSVPASKRADLAAALGTGRQLGVILVRFLHQLRAGTYELATFSQVQSQSVTLREQINAHFRKAGLTRCVTSA